MTNTFRGLYRTVTGAYVVANDMALQVPEADYRAFGYEPIYDNLPWKEDYDRQSRLVASRNPTD